MPRPIVASAIFDAADRFMTGLHRTAWSAHLPGAGAHVNVTFASVPTRWPSVWQRWLHAGAQSVGHPARTAMPTASPLEQPVPGGRIGRRDQGPLNIGSRSSIFAALEEDAIERPLPGRDCREGKGGGFGEIQRRRLRCSAALPLRQKNRAVHECACAPAHAGSGRAMDSTARAVVCAGSP